MYCHFGQFQNRKIMTDYTMCTTKICPIKKSCYRFTAEPEKYWQSYNDFYDADRNDCKYYIKETNEVEVTQKAVQAVSHFFRNL